jgi:hypothetical protein
MKKTNPIQFTGLLTIAVFIIFIAMQHRIPLFRRLNLLQTITFFAFQLVMSLLGGIYSFVKGNISFRKTFGTLNIIIAAMWSMIIYAIITFPAQQ